MSSNASKILIIDDDASIRHTMGEVVALVGWEVLEAESSQQALEVCQAHQDEIALIFLDLTLPDKPDGLPLHRALTSIVPGAPLIVVSGYSRSDANQRHPDLAGYPYLQKPFDLDDLINSVEQALGRQ